MDPNAHIGFHAVKNESTNEISSWGNAVVGAYLYETGITDFNAIRIITAANPKSMMWLVTAQTQTTITSIWGRSPSLRKRNGRGHAQHLTHQSSNPTTPHGLLLGWRRRSPDNQACTTQKSRCRGASFACSGSYSRRRISSSLCRASRGWRWQSAAYSRRRGDCAICARTHGQNPRQCWSRAGTTPAWLQHPSAGSSSPASVRASRCSVRSRRVAASRVASGTGA
jgi:hypothetical protein